MTDHRRTENSSRPSVIEIAEGLGTRAARWCHGFMSEDKRHFVASRLDGLIHALELQAPTEEEPSPVPTANGFTGSLAEAQRHRAELESATPARVDEIAAGYPEIAKDWAEQQSA
jgi:hypothetical protein